MNLTKIAFNLFQERMANGFWFKLRHAYPNPWNILLSFWNSPPSLKHPLEVVPKDAKIVIVGLGPAALSFAKELFKIGFINIRFISRDDLYGGKCVNFGCMPTEFIFSVSHIPVEKRSQSLNEFIFALRSDVKAQFEIMGMPLTHAEVKSIEGNFLQLSDGTSVPFDRLIMASGSHYPPPIKVPLGTSKLISIKDFWQLPPHGHIVIYAKDNPVAISIAEAALVLGLQVTLLLSGTNPFGNLPSWKYFLKNCMKRGIAVFDQGVRLIRVDEKGVSFEKGAQIETVTYDHLLIMSKPTPAYLPTDGQLPSVFDLNFNLSIHPNRPDIYFAGDAAGYFTAAEAEEQARFLARSLATTNALDLSPLLEIPINIHGTTPLLIIGQPWTWNASPKSWKEIDFRQIGWTKVHGQEGKLWYLPGERKGFIDAIHICHPLAKELISIAKLLIKYPISDPAWSMSFVHPSAAEIFKLIE